MTPDAAIEVEDLVKSYAGRRVLDGVQFSVARGEIVALLGPNGAGKTTTVETIEGYRRADGGSVRVLGHDPGEGETALRARVGLMLQGGGGLEPRLTPRESVNLYARFHRDAGPADHILERVGLAGAADTRVRRLSGGERQRLALALALVGRPEVLVLDEPTAGLDPAGRAEARSLLRTLRDDGAAVLLTTHDLADVERVADRAVVLHQGRIVAEGRPEAVGTGDATRLDARFAAAVPVAGLRAALVNRWPAVTLEPAEGSSTSVVVRGVPIEPALVAAVAAWAAEHGVLLAELRAGAASLEERYLTLIGDRPMERDGVP